MMRAPGPKGLPFVGNLFPALRDPIALFLEAQRDFGDVFRLELGPYEYYVVNDPEIVRHVLVDNAKVYTKSRNYLGLRVVLGEGLLTSEGDRWRRQRRLAQPAFHRDRLNGFARAMASATRDMLDGWMAEGHENTFCVHRAMMHLTFRIVGLTLFSADVHGDAKDVGEAMTIALEWANDHAESILPVPPAVPTPANLRFKRAMKTLDALVYRLIAERRAAATSGNDLLGLLMDATEEDGTSKMDDRQVRDEAITMVLAGHETTANLLAWTLHLLSKHPDIERRVREEATRVLGDRDPVLADMKALELTRRVLDEALRLFPPAWVFERQATEADTLGPYRIAPKAMVGISPYVLHRHAKYWENPEGFDPDRFLPERSAKRPRYVYLPFGGGPRTCIGNHFAMMEAQIILAMILRAFHIELDPTHKIELDPAITLRPRTGIRVRRRPVGPAVANAA